MDVHTKEIRSFNMSRIRSKDTKPEMLVRRYLHKVGLRFRLHDKNLPGKPDIVLPKYKTVIFVHGCFWHGHENCKYYAVPKSRTEWWLQKISKNKTNDTINIEKLELQGWNIITVHECQLKKTVIDETLVRVVEILKQTI